MRSTRSSHGVSSSARVDGPPNSLHTYDATAALVHLRVTAPEDLMQDTHARCCGHPGRLGSNCYQLQRASPGHAYTMYTSQTLARWACSCVASRLQFSALAQPARRCHRRLCDASLINQASLLVAVIALLSGRTCWH
eukprot:jgi/Ulvmu1/9871/UM057_0025.1